LHSSRPSSAQYGALFVPQAALAVVASLSGAALTRRAGVTRIYALGPCANLASMLLLLASAFVGTPSVATMTLSVATAALGLGFGFTVPSLNTLAALFFPAAVDRAILAAALASLALTATVRSGSTPTSARSPTCNG
jgi:MFS family permease